jgi:hypothetical protein
MFETRAGLAGHSCDTRNPIEKGGRWLACSHAQFVLSISLTPADSWDRVARLRSRLFVRPGWSAKFSGALALAQLQR